MLKRTLTSAAVAAAFAFAAAPASAEFLDFQVDEGSVPGGTTALSFWADKLNGTYTEKVTITGATTFAAQAYAEFGQFVANDGTSSVSSWLNSPEPVGYRLYALFEAQGTFSGTTLTGGTGAFTLYIDPNSNTSFSLTDGVAAPTVGGNVDDYKIAFTTSLVYGAGQVAGPIRAFDFIFTDFALTTGDQSAFWAGDQAGDKYFTAPSPFYIRTQVNGDIDQVPALTPGLTYDITGDVSAVFVPEPGTLALAGLALGAMGFVTRRRRAA